MFDRYARIGLLDRKDDAISFYQTLASQGFAERASDITNVCRHRMFELWGERIIDKLLLFRGSVTDTLDRQLPESESYFAAAVALNKQYLQLIPTELSKRLHNLALKVADVLPDDSFPQKISPRRKIRAGKAEFSLSSMMSDS